MLSRTAENLYWLARHIERAENTARVLDVAHLTSLLPLDIEGSQAYLWYAPLNITGCADSYEAKYGLARADAVFSVKSCFRLRGPPNASNRFFAVNFGRGRLRHAFAMLPSMDNIFAGMLKHINNE